MSKFERGAGQERAGFKIAFALPAEGRPPREPDRLHWWVKADDGDWRLVDLAALAERCLLPLPLELTTDYFARAWHEQMNAAGRFLRQITALPETPPPTQEAPRLWWLND